MRNIEKLLEKVNAIPHLPLKFSYDAKRIEQEIRECPFPLMPYHATMQDNHDHLKTNRVYSSSLKNHSPVDFI